MKKQNRKDEWFDVASAIFLWAKDPAVISITKAKLEVGGTEDLDLFYDVNAEALHSIPLENEVDLNRGCWDRVYLMLQLALENSY